MVIGRAPSNVNVDYVQEAMHEYEQILKDTPEVDFSMVISGAMGVTNPLVW